MTQRIPKIIHQIWYQGEEEMPECYHYFAKHLKELHPDWEYKLWTADNMIPLINQKIHDEQPRYLFKSNISRFEILARYGGLYIDSDFLILKNLEPLMQNTDHVLLGNFRKGAYQVCNGFVGATPNHPLCWQMVRGLGNRSREFPEQNQYANCIPYFDDTVKQTIPEPLIIPMELFFPVRADFVMDNQFEYSGMHYATHMFNNRHDGEGVVAHKKLPCYLRDHAYE